MAQKLTKAKTMPKNNEFFRELSEFYELFFESISKTYKVLANVQKKHHVEYDKFIEVNQNPSAILVAFSQMSDSEKMFMFKLLVKAGDFGRRCSTVMESTASEKETLSKDLYEFSKELKATIKP